MFWQVNVDTESIEWALINTRHLLTLFLNHSVQVVLLLLQRDILVLQL